MKKFVLTTLVLFLSIAFSAYSQEKKYGWINIPIPAGSISAIESTDRYLYISGSKSVDGVLYESIITIDSNKNVTTIYDIPATPAAAGNNCIVKSRSAIYGEPYPPPHFLYKNVCLWFYDWTDNTLSVFEEQETYPTGVEIIAKYPVKDGLKEFCIDESRRYIYYIAANTLYGIPIGNPNGVPMDNTINNPTESEFLSDFTNEYKRFPHYGWGTPARGLRIDEEGNIWYTSTSLPFPAINCYNPLTREIISYDRTSWTNDSGKLEFIKVWPGDVVPVFCLFPRPYGYDKISLGVTKLQIFRDGWDLFTIIPDEHIFNDIYGLFPWSDNELVIVRGNVNWIHANPPGKAKLLIYNLDTKQWREAPGKESSEYSIKQIFFWKGKQYLFNRKYVYVYDVIDSTNIADAPPLPSFKIFPNPAKDMITVTLATQDVPSVVTISNEAGQEIFTQTIVNTQDIDISAFHAGVYFVKVGDEVEKLVVK